jgi:molybdate transport system substrate-binding protein
MLTAPDSPAQRRRIRRLLCLAPLACSPCAVPAAAGTGTVTVAAAADLKGPLDEIARAFEQASGQSVRIVYGSSGNLARQIEQGAPFDVFMSADESLVEGLARKGLTTDSGSLYGIGRIVVFSARTEVLTADENLVGLRQALAAGRIHRFAIANPEHAPYGRAARQALQRAGLWQALGPRLVLGENVSQAAQFAAGGGAQGGIFALSLALTPEVARRGTYAVLPESMHEPLRQRMAVLRRAPPQATTFHAFVQQPQARRELERYGFAPPRD